VVGADRRTDVALLKIEATGLPVAVIGDSSRVAPGDWVAAIGAPFGFHGSITTGVVSAKDRFIAGAGKIPFIQTDTAINLGSSGSPLFNSRGEVVAINSVIYSGSGGYMRLSFAVPINLVMKIAAQLRSTGWVRRGYLGAEFQEMTPALAQSFALPDAAGALVVRVDADSDAHLAGLARGDVVTPSTAHGSRISRSCCSGSPTRRPVPEAGWTFGAAAGNTRSGPWSASSRRRQERWRDPDLSPRGAMAWA
jgi:serine protease Do